MTDEPDDISSAASGDPLAAQIALGSGTGAEARDYLRKQSRIADLTIDTLQKKDEFELSHLRFRRFSDFARFALEVAGFLVVLLVVCGLASMVWNASRERGLVVDAFSVPQDLAQTGMTGSVVANRLIDKLGKLQAASFADWAGAARAGADADAILKPQPTLHWERVVFVWPIWAESMARGGDLAGAQARIAKAPLDCDDCMRKRGRIAALKHDWAGAARWFAMVSARSPHIPFADTDWGAMLMAKGDLDGAAAKFETAHKKGPHFADPLEMWGEVMIARNRSDLALAKFEEANKYAPNWKRLHRKWGEALTYAGRKDEAAKQFALARSLDG